MRLGRVRWRVVVGRTSLVLVALVVATGGCSGDASSVDTTVPHTGPTDDLAPSQLTAATAAPPDIPLPCDPDALAIWTSQVVVEGDWADAVLRVRNDGDVWCEVDVAGSPSVDPAMEPDVWLDPGAWADLVLGPPDGECQTPAMVGLAQLDVNGSKVVVETAAVVPCGWRLTAFYPNDVSDESCSELGVVAVEGALVVRNSSFQPCRLGALVSATGEGVAIVPGEPEVAVPMLAGGDLVAFELTAAGSCDVRPVELVFEGDLTVEVPLGGCTVSVGSGAPQPWIGGPGSPTADDPAALLAQLDPFADRA